MKILLDTHAYVWWETGDRKLSVPAREAISDGGAIVLVSAVVAWEIANKVRAGRWPEAAFLVGDIETAIEEEAFEPLPITVAHARLAGSLPGPHRDPFDRLLAAQAAVEDAALVTADPAFGSFGTRVVW